MGCLQSLLEDPAQSNTALVVYNKWAILSRRDPCFFTIATGLGVNVVVDASLKTITRVDDSGYTNNYAFINVPLTIGSQLTLTTNTLDSNRINSYERGLTFSLTDKTPQELLDAYELVDTFHKVVNFTTVVGDKMTIKRLSDTQLAYSIYPDREQRCVIIDDIRATDVKAYVYPVLSVTGYVTQVTIDSYIPNPAGCNPEMSDLEQVFLLDPLRVFTRTPLTNFVPIGDVVNFVLPTCIPHIGIELAENKFAVKRIRRPFDNYNNVIFLDVDFPRGSKLVVRIESISQLDYHYKKAFTFQVSTQLPTLIESMEQIKDLYEKSWHNDVYIVAENTRTVQDITFIRQPNGSVMVTPVKAEGSCAMNFGRLAERNDVYPYINLIGSVDRISLIEYRRGDGKNVQDLGLDLMPAI